MFFKIVVERKAGIVLKTFPGLRAGRLGIERHARLKLVERIGETRGLFRFGTRSDRFLSDGFRRGTGRGSRTRWNRLGGRRRRFGFGSRGRRWWSGLFRRG
jgi:hypothetical protein